MRHLSWSDDYRIGVETFDDEHKRILAYFNEVRDAFMRGADLATLEKLYDEAVDYIVAHFAHEEAHFDDCPYPQKQSHLESHAYIRREMAACRAHLAEWSRTGAGENLFAVLGAGVIEQILYEDKLFGQCLCANGVCAAEGEAAFCT